MTLTRRSSKEKICLFLLDAKSSILDPSAMELLQRAEEAVLYDDDIEHPVNHSRVQCVYPLEVLAHLHQRHQNRQDKRQNKRNFHRPAPQVTKQVDEQLQEEYSSTIPDIYLG